MGFSTVYLGNFYVLSYTQKCKIQFFRKDGYQATRSENSEQNNGCCKSGTTIWIFTKLGSMCLATGKEVVHP